MTRRSLTAMAMRLRTVSEDLRSVVFAIRGESDDTVTTAGLDSRIDAIDASARRWAGRST